MPPARTVGGTGTLRRSCWPTDMGCAPASWWRCAGTTSTCKPESCTCDGVIEVWQDRFVLAVDPGGVEYDAAQTDALMAARFKKRSAEAAQDTSRAAISSLSGLICGFPS